MNLSHFSNSPILRPYPAKQFWRYGRASFHEKPKGLWVSVDGDDDWLSWCTAENFGIKPYRHRIVLANNACILYCDCAAELEKLQKDYGSLDPGLSGHMEEYFIDWGKLAEDYQGIIIAPYVWRCRMDMMWYYGWDCASGCIWDPAAIQSTEFIGEISLSNPPEDTATSSPYSTDATCPPTDGADSAGST